MRSKDELQQAKLVIIQQLGRRDIGRSDQRAFLRGLLAFARWLEDAPGSLTDGDVVAVYKLMEGQDVRECDEAKLSNPRSVVGPPDLQAREKKIIVGGV